jgi:hypothetical protein
MLNDAHAHIYTYDTYAHIQTCTLQKSRWCSPQSCMHAINMVSETAHYSNAHIQNHMYTHECTHPSAYALVRTVMYSATPSNLLMTVMRTYAPGDLLVQLYRTCYAYKYIMRHAYKHLQRVMHTNIYNVSCIQIYATCHAYKHIRVMHTHI